MALVSSPLTISYSNIGRVASNLSSAYNINNSIAYPLVNGLAPSGRCLLIIGTAPKGPVLKPLYITSAQQASYYFGDKIAKVFSEAKRGGAEYILIMRIGELAATYTDPTKDQLYIYLQQAYETLYGIPFDYILPVDAYYDDTLDLTGSTDHISFIGSDGISLSYASQLADFCKNKLDMGEYCHGIIGMQKPGSDLALWKQRMINSSLLFNYDGSYDLSKKYIEGSDDYGKFITVVGSWVNHIIDDKTEYETSGASVYAGLLASLDSSESPTNKSVDGILPVEVFESDDLDDLAEAGFTMFRSTIRNGVCPYEAVSFAGPSSDFHSVANIRILNDTCNRIQRAIDIGDTIGKATAEDKARSVLSDMVRDKEIRDFSLGSEILTANKIALYIEIYPFFYVSSISTSIKVNTIGE